MNEDEPARETAHAAEGDPASELRLEALQKTLHHIEAIKHILDVSGSRPEPLELTLRNLEKLLDKAHAQVRGGLNPIQGVRPS
jgi:hypothetical protein